MPAIELALETLQRKKQALVFAASRASAEKLAEDISKQIMRVTGEDVEQQIHASIPSPTKQCERLAKCVKKGVAFHHSGLTQKQKDIIEKEFRNGNISIICCTPTLAMGVSLPAFRVIMNGLKRYSGSWGMDWIPVLEYLQCAGRAGRPEFEKFGEAISIAKTDAQKEEIYERFVLGKPEEIYSKLAVEPVLRTYLLSLISTGMVRSEKDVMKFFAGTFWAHQFKDMEKLKVIIDKMLHLLEEFNFITVHGQDDFVSGSDVGKSSLIRPTLVGKRVSELYLDPLTANYLITGLKNYESSTFSLLQLISHTLEMRPLLRIKAAERGKMEEELVAHYDYLLHPEPRLTDPSYGDFMNSIKTTLFLTSWIDEMTEPDLMEKYSVRPGEIKYKTDNADWLLYASAELAKLIDRQSIVKDLVRLRIRINYGVKEELLALLKLKGIGRKRARKLFDNSIKDLGDVKKSDIGALSQLVGGKIAVSVKKQLGQSVEEVSERKRIGQMSIGKFT
tara:strand:+ start:4542 stop:6056 length:1515 start_codon:yes stop_codon:yes gene_type:complete